MASLPTRSIAIGKQNVRIHTGAAKESERLARQRQGYQDWKPNPHATIAANADSLIKFVVDKTISRRTAFTERCDYMLERMERAATVRRPKRSLEESALNVLRRIKERLKAELYERPTKVVDTVDFQMSPDGVVERRYTKENPPSGSHKKNPLPLWAAEAAFNRAIEKEAFMCYEYFDGTHVAGGEWQTPLPLQYYSCLDVAEGLDIDEIGDWGYICGPARTAKPRIPIAGPYAKWRDPHRPPDSTRHLFGFRDPRASFGLRVRIAHLRHARTGVVPAIFIWTRHNWTNCWPSTHDFLRELQHLSPAAVALYHWHQSAVRPQGDTSNIKAQSIVHFALGGAVALLARKACSGFKVTLDLKGPLVEEISKTVEKVRAESSKVLGIMSSTMGKFVTALVVGVPLVAAAWYALRHPHTTLMAMAVFAVIKAQLGEKTWDAIKKFFVKPGTEEPLDPSEVRAQAGEENAAGELISTVLTFAACDGKHAFASPQDIQRRMAFKDRATEGWSSFSRSVVKAIEWFVNMWRDMFGKERVRLVKTGTYVCDEWDVRVRQFLEPIEQGKREVEAKDGDLCADLIRQGEVLSKSYHTMPPLVRLMDKRINSLRKFQGENRGAFSAARGSRAEPVCFCIRGTAGVGKSHLMRTIIHTVLASYLDEKVCEELQYQFDDEVFSHDSGQYWEGYRSQKVLVIDDWLQASMAPGSEHNDAMTLIRAVNEWPWPLNMAFGGKGCTFFSSPLVCLTTNAKTLQAAQAALACTDALHRRIHLPYELRLKREYALDNKLNITLHNQKSDEQGSFFLGAWEMYKHDFSTGQTSSDPVSVEQVIGEIVSELRRRFGAHKSHDASTRALAKAVRAKGVSAFVEEGKKAHQDERTKRELDAIAERKSKLSPSSLAMAPGILAPPPGMTPAPIHKSQSTVEAQSLPEIVEEDSDLPSDNEDKVAGSVKEWLLDPSSDIDSLSAVLCKERCEETVQELAEKARGKRRAPRVRSLAEQAMTSFNNFTGGWKWFWKGALVVVLVALLGKALKEASKTIFGIFGHKEKKYNLTKEEQLERKLEKTDKRVALAAMQLVKGISPDELSEEGVLPDYVYERYLARLAVGQSNARESKGDRRKRMDRPTQGPSDRARELEKKGVDTDAPWRRAGYKTAHSEVEAQSLVQVAQDIREIVRRNAFKVVLSKGDRRRTLGTLVLVQGNIALVPAHFFSTIQEYKRIHEFDGDDIVEFINCKTPLLSVQGMTLNSFGELERHEVCDDCALVKFPVSTPSGKDIVENFMTERDYENVTYATLLLDPSPIDHKTNQVRDVLHSLRVEAASDIEYSTQDVRVCAERTYEYRNSPLKNGDCGALSYVADNTGVGPRVLAGIHIAGSDEGVGYTLVPTQESIRAALRRFREPVIAQCNIGMPELTQDPVAQEGYGSITPIGKVAKPFNQPGKSKYIRTELHNAWGKCNEMPGMLAPFRTRDSGTISPMANALANYNGPIEYINDAALKRAAHTAFRAFEKVTHDWKRKTYSFEEAVRGDAYVTNASALTMGTSPGYPWNIEGHTNKRKIFGSGPDPDFTTPYAIKLREEVEEVVARAKKGERCVHIFSDFLKDQLMDIGKVAKGKGRLISGAPLTYVVAWRMLFLSFTAAVQSNPLTSGIAIGMNPYKDWTAMVRHLRMMSPHMIAGDYKAFDGRELQQVHLEICANINRWYSGTAEESLARRVLYMEVCHSYHLAGFGLQRDTIVKWSKSLPSGHPGTAVLNSFYNLTVLVLMFDLLLQSYGYDFWDVVRPVVYGDDNVMSVSPCVLHLFNQSTLQMCAPIFGMTYTPEDKEAMNVAPSRPIEEVSFLKRRFHQDQGQWACPLDLDSILWRCYWVRDASHAIPITECNFEETLQELALHSDETWAHWVPAILQGAKKHPTAMIPRLPVDERSYYRAAILSRDAAW